MRLLWTLALLLPCAVSAQKGLFAETPGYAATFSLVDLALSDVELSRVGVVVSLGRIRERHERTTKDGLESKVLRLPKLGAGISKTDPAWPHVETARSAWTGLLSASSSAIESGSALEEANAAAVRLGQKAKELGSAGAARESLEQPGAQRLALIREAERRLGLARADRVRSLARARSLEEEVPKIQALQRQAVADALGGSSARAREADLLAAKASRAAADAALAYAEAAKHAAYEVRMAQSMVEAYADLSTESVSLSRTYGIGR